MVDHTGNLQPLPGIFPDHIAPVVSAGGDGREPATHPAGAGGGMMCRVAPQAVTITVDDVHNVSGLLQVPQRARASYVLAHGAGAGMTHAFIAAIAEGLGAHGIATLRYQFPYMERGSRRPDAPGLAHATVRAAVTAAARLMPALPRFAGGKSFGARMTSQAQACAPLPDVRGLAFLGFPLHPAGQPSADRAQHLFDVHVPMLFLQGTRDALADLRLLVPLVEQLGPDATLSLAEDGDHTFHVRARSGRTDEQALGEALTSLVGWIEKLL